MRKRFVLKVSCLSLALLTLPACSSFQKESAPPIAFYVLDPDTVARVQTPSGLRTPFGTLIVTPVAAAAGFTGTRMVYTRQPHRLEYFALSEWADTPARMLAPLIVRRLQEAGLFDAVVPTPSAVAANWRLNTEIIRLQQEFTGGTSQIRLILRAHLVEEKTRRVLVVREFEVVEAAASAGPYGGVIAANIAVSAMLGELVDMARGLEPAHDPRSAGQEAGP